MDSKGMIKKERVYLYVAVALIIGFVGGVMYSAYRTPATAEVHQDGGGHQREAAATIAALEKATKDNPKDGQLWVELGHAYFDTGQAKQAIAAYHKALELLPGDLNVMTDLGVMYHQDNQHQKAIEMFDQVLRVNPEHEQARFNKGVVLLTGLNDPKGAVAEWKILLKYHPMAAAPSGKMVADLIEQLEKQTKETAKP
ncbi:MAG: tetratricopeptide repeat protein [Desulfobulbus sp.]|uniref:tetratricopeptide repeat protein n=1 Tax=Desulfobulbus sp. TaxID=895 RepID=UPI00284D5C2E|nr:tetratricopeptide repeat protein [Desulfobulbus sp.]MDR2549441.1 tetratricopeptide repeat protein [Desulfobulbus sp.]